MHALLKAEALNVSAKSYIIRMLSTQMSCTNIPFSFEQRQEIALSDLKNNKKTSFFYLCDCVLTKAFEAFDKILISCYKQILSQMFCDANSSCVYESAHFVCFMLKILLTYFMVIFQVFNIIENLTSS